MAKDVGRVQRGEPQEHWLQQKHPEYLRLAPQWRYIEDHYKALVITPEKVGDYLIKRVQGETDEAWTERKAIADYTPHMATVVDSLAGMLFNVDDDARREFGILGKPANIKTVIGRLWKDADLAGNGWLTVFKELTTSLIHSSRWWILVEGGSTGDARVRLLSPLTVTNWFDANGRPTEVIVTEAMDLRTSIRDEPSATETYVHFTLDGWQRYRLSDKKDTGGKVQEIPVGEPGTYHFEDPTGQRVLPIYPVELPLRRMGRRLNVVQAALVFGSSG